MQLLNDVHACSSLFMAHIYTGGSHGSVAARRKRRFWAFPGSEDGCFNLNNISAFTTMIVEGPPVNGYFQRAQGTRGQSIVPSV